MPNTARLPWAVPVHHFFLNDGDQDRNAKGSPSLRRKEKGLVDLAKSPSAPGWLWDPLMWGCALVGMGAPPSPRHILG